METHIVKVSENDNGQRLDKVLANHLPDLSRARLQGLIQSGQVSFGGQVFTTVSFKVSVGEEFIVKIPPAMEAEPQPQDIPLDIVFEDEHLLVINKAVGLVVHPGAGNHDGTLVNALLAHCGDQLSGIGGVKRPGIVHRLDKETSGLMVVAKNDKAHHGLSEQLSTRTLKRVYHCLVWGRVAPPEGRIETQIGRSKTNRKKMAVLPMGGKEAVTEYKVLEHFGILASHVECRLQTGRTHQIRVHMAHLQNWLIGDPTYGRPSIRKFLKLNKIDDDVAQHLIDFPRQALHAAEIAFVHPITGDEMGFAVDLPKDMLDLKDLMRQK